jgi:GTP-binding protein
MRIVQAEFIKSSSKFSECPGDKKNEYAFTGRSNVGKSSLINMLTNKRKLAKISSTPGKTQLINHFMIDQQWYLVDLPGYGYAKVSKNKRKAFTGLISDYIQKRESLVNVFVLIDCRHEPLKNDLVFMEWLTINQVPFSMVFTKIDKLSSSKLNKNLKVYKNEMLKTWEFMPPVFTTSAEKGIGKDEILGYISELNKKVRLFD